MNGPHLFFASRKAGTLRFSADYRKLNAVSLRGSEILERTDECIYCIEDVKIFLNLNDNSIYWRKDVNKKDLEKTTFTTHCQFYQFKRMTFVSKIPQLHFNLSWISFRQAWSGSLTSFIWTISLYFPRPFSNISRTPQLYSMFLSKPVLHRNLKIGLPHQPYKLLRSHYSTRPTVNHYSYSRRNTRIKNTDNCKWATLDFGFMQHIFEDLF